MVWAAARGVVGVLHDTGLDHRLVREIGADVAVSWRALAGEHEVGQLLAIERLQHRPSETDVSHDRRVGVRELWIERSPVLRLDLHPTFGPLFSRLERHVERDRFSQGQVQPRQHIGKQRVVVGNEADFDLVDLRSPKHIPVERGQDHVAISNPVLDLERARTDEAFVPARES